MNQAISLLFVSLFASVIAFGEPCRYAEFQPDHVYHRVIYRAHQIEVGALGPAIPIKGLPVGRSSLLYDGAVVAQISQVRNPATGVNELTVFHPLTEQILLQMTESVYVCDSGLCHKVEMWNDQQKPTKTMPFVVSYGPRDYSPVVFSRYGIEVGYTTFRKEFSSSFDWLFDVLVTSKVGFRPDHKNSNERITWELVSDPAVAPYFDRFTVIVSKGDPRVMEVYGTAPSNFIYGRVIDSVRRAGFPYVNPLMRIDTRTAINWVRPYVTGCGY